MAQLTQKNDMSFMSELFNNFNGTNLNLQGNILNLIKTESIISTFVANLFLYKQNLETGECSQFPNLSKLQSRDKDFLAYCQNLTALHADLNQRFEGIPHLDIPDLQLNAFARGQTQIPNTDESIRIQEQLIEMKNLNQCLN